VHTKTILSVAAEHHQQSCITAKSDVRPLHLFCCWSNGPMSSR